MQAALGRIQLKRMPEWMSKRTANSEKILSVALDYPVYRVPSMMTDCQHAWYKCYLFVNEKSLKEGWSRDRIVAEINERGVPCYQGSCSEIYLEKAFDSSLRPTERLFNAKELGETSLMFLVHPTLNSDEMELTCRAIAEVGKLAGNS